jgi:hypothetical protein
MPAPQLHLTFGELVAHHPGVTAAARRAVQLEPTYTRLGSIFHDLPYYGNMLAEAIRYGFRRPAIDAPWAYRMHCIRPDRFVAGYVRSAATTPGLSDDERMALVAGLASHCALDLSLHPLVNYCARRDTALYGGHETFHHRLAEKYQALFFHLERFGEDPIGTREFQLRTQVVKRGSLTRAEAEPAIVAFAQGAFRNAYGTAPPARTWAGWARSFRHFGLLVGGRLAARNSKKVRRDPALVARYVRSDEFNFDAFYRCAVERVAELVNLSAGYLEAGDFSEAAELRFCAAARIDDLAEPSGRGLPRLPSLPTPSDRPRRRLPLPLGRRRADASAAATG